MDVRERRILKRVEKERRNNRGGIAAPIFFILYHFFFVLLQHDKNPLYQPYEDGRHDCL